MLYRTVSWCFALLLLLYITSYLFLKYECTLERYVPVDPWKASTLSLKSRTTYWGPVNLTTRTYDPKFRDPGYAISDEMRRILNRLYRPAQLVDQRLTGWAVGFWIDPRQTK